MTLFDEPKPEITLDNNSLYAIIDRRDDYIEKLSGKVKDIESWLSLPKIKLGCKPPNYLIWNNKTELLDKLIQSGELS